MGESTQPNASTLTARAVVTELISQGIRHVVYCPGSRSAPLAYALADAQAAGALQVRVVLDERSAGFIALGMARADLLAGRRRPAVVVTTSGTAVANLHPAVAEADAAGIPLLVLSADRPAELVGTGANQTTKQAGIFGQNLRHLADLPADLPLSLGERAVAAISGQLLRAVAAATGAFTNDPGPVQINLQLRPPLTPPSSPHPWLPAELGPETEPLPLDLPASADCTLTPSPTAASHGVVVAGNCPDPRFGQLARLCAEILQWPLLAEPTSGARAGECAIAPYNALLRTELADQIDTVLVFGHSTLTRPVQALLARPEVHRTVVTERARWVDTAGQPAQVVDAWALADELVAGGEYTLLENCAPAPADWLEQWQQVAQNLAQTGPQVEDPLLDEAARAVWESCQGQAAPLLMVGSSMTIRRLDNQPLTCSEDQPTALANRGLAGIDGTISTAVGLAAATGQPVRVILGDLSFQHDALALARGAAEADVDLQVIVLDDAGGAIFSQLEYAHRSPEILERFFTTAQACDIVALAESLGARATDVTSVAELAELLSAPVHGRSVIRVHQH